MNTNVSGYSQIRSLEDLKLQKQKINKKLRLRKRLMGKHFNDLNDELSFNYAFRQTLKLLKVNNPYTGMAGNFLKDQMLNKNVLIPLISGVASAIGSFFLMKKFRNRKN